MGRVMDDAKGIDQIVRSGRDELGQSLGIRFDELDAILKTKHMCTLLCEFDRSA